MNVPKQAYKNLKTSLSDRDLTGLVSLTFGGLASEVGISFKYPHFFTSTSRFMAEIRLG